MILSHRLLYFGQFINALGSPGCTMSGAIFVCACRKVVVFPLKGRNHRKLDSRTGSGEK